MTYDPAFAYELAVIMQDGIKRMYQDKEDLFYYITVYNENYTSSDAENDAQDGIKDMLFQRSFRSIIK